MVKCRTCHSENILLKDGECFCTHCGARNPARLPPPNSIDNLKHAIESIDGLRARIKCTESFETEVFERKHAEEKLADLRQEMTQKVDELEERMADLRPDADMARIEAGWSHG